MKSLIDLFKTPTADEIAARELAEARRELLSAQSALDYAKALSNYNKERIVRLENHLKGVSDAGKSERPDGK